MSFTSPMAFCTLPATIGFSFSLRFDIAGELAGGIRDTFLPASRHLGTNPCPSNVFLS
jgi:hypothetical protein